MYSSGGQDWKGWIYKNSLFNPDNRKVYTVKHLSW